MAGIARHDGDRPADGVAAEQGALRALEDLDPVDVEHVGVRPDAAGEVDAVDIDPDARVEVEGEVVLADAADIGGQHRVRSGEGRAGVQSDVGRDVGQLGDIVDALLAQSLGGHRRDGDRHVLNILGGFLGGDDHLFHRAWRRGLSQGQSRQQQPGDQHRGRHQSGFQDGHDFSPRVSATAPLLRADVLVIQGKYQPRPSWFSAVGEEDSMGGEVASGQLAPCRPAKPSLPKVARGRRRDNRGG